MEIKNTLKILPVKFYERDTREVSKDLLGKILVRKSKNGTLTVKIVETEAYIGDHDPACHSYNKFTERNKVMFERGGKVYVYFIYGNYYCFNVVTGKPGEGNAVLIRAVEPLTGIEIMKKFRGSVKNLFELTNGPAKLCMAMNIDKKLYGCDVTDGNGKVFISENPDKENFVTLTSKRIGLSAGSEFPYRYFIKDNPFVTKHKFNNEIIIKKNTT